MTLCSKISKIGMAITKISNLAWSKETEKRMTQGAIIETTTIETTTAERKIERISSKTEDRDTDSDGTGLGEPAIADDDDVHVEDIE